VNDELFSPSTLFNNKLTASRQCGPFVQPININIPGGTLGNIAMSGLMKCQYRRRQIQFNNISMSSPQSVENQNGRNRIHNSNTNQPRQQTTVNSIASVEEFSRKRSLSDDFVGLNVGADWKLQFVVLTEWIGRGRLLLFDPYTYVLNAVVFMESVLEVMFCLYTFLINSAILPDIRY
jgi:hypothetical protein